MGLSLRRAVPLRPGTDVPQWQDHEATRFMMPLAFAYRKDSRRDFRVHAQIQRRPYDRAPRGKGDADAAGRPTRSGTEHASCFLWAKASGIINRVASYWSCSGLLAPECISVRRCWSLRAHLQRLAMI